jgi:hypothetical protein
MNFPLNKVYSSIKIFGLYSLVMGLVLLFIPGLILPLVGLPVSSEPWLHLLGFVLICSSYYYLRSASDKNPEFARYTVHTRLTAPLVVIFLVGTGKADWHFISFGVIDGLGGLWTLFELNKIKKIKKT